MKIISRLINEDAFWIMLIGICLSASVALASPKPNGELMLGGSISIGFTTGWSIIVFKRARGPRAFVYCLAGLVAGALGYLFASAIV